MIYIEDVEKKSNSIGDIFFYTIFQVGMKLKILLKIRNTNQNIQLQTFTHQTGMHNYKTINCQKKWLLIILKLNLEFRHYKI